MAEALISSGSGPATQGLAAQTGLGLPARNCRPRNAGGQRAASMDAVQAPTL